MGKLELSLLVFAPALIGLVVTVLRRTAIGVYWGSLGILVLLIAVSTAGLKVQSGDLGIGSILFATVFLVVPTIAAFVAGHVTEPQRGGASLFAVAASAYLLALCIAALGVAAARSLFS